MKHAALLLIALTAVGCKKKQSEGTSTAGSGSTMVGSGSAAAGSGSAMAGSGSDSASGSAGSGSGSAMAGSGSGADTGSAGSGSAAPTQTGFARFDDALAGKTPWITADEAKAGIVEMIAVDDLSGKSKGTFLTERRCGAAAKKAAESMGAAFTGRAKDGNHDPAECKDEGEMKMCFAGGIAEGDVSYVMEYKKAGDNWQLVGVSTTAVGLITEKQDAVYKKLLAAKCK